LRGNSRSTLSEGKANRFRIVVMRQAVRPSPIAEVEKLLVELNATQTIFPGTRLRLIFKIGSS